MTSAERTNDKAYIGDSVESAKHKRALSPWRNLSEESPYGGYAVFENTFLGIIIIIILLFLILVLIKRFITPLGRIKALIIISCKVCGAKY